MTIGCHTPRALHTAAALTALLTTAAAPAATAVHAPPRSGVANPATTPGRAAGVKSAARPAPYPLSGHHKAITGEHRQSSTATPTRTVARATAAARVEPQSESWLNAIQRYAYADGALYQVYAAPGRVTDIMLQPGETLVGDGPVAAGDTVRWVIGDTVSGSGEAARVHILIKPTRADLVSNMVINTDRRSYHVELRSDPTTYMAAVSWRYPQDALIAIKQAQRDAARAAPAATGIDPAHLAFGYRISGDHVAWRPLRAFDDGRQAFIEFPESIGTADMPPLFVIGPDGRDALVNYRVQGRYMVVDRLFGAAELRIGDHKTEKTVRITRTGGDLR